MGLETVLVALGKTDKKRLDKLAETTIDIAGPADASVELAHVYTDEEYERAKRNLNFDDDSEVTPATVARRQQTVRDMQKKIVDTGLAVNIHGGLTEDDRSTEIIELAEAVDADLVIVGGRKRTATGKAVFGSTAQSVLMNAPSPVTFVRTD